MSGPWARVASGPAFHDLLRTHVPFRPRESTSGRGGTSCRTRRSETTMTGATWITMIVICAFVWGGFVTAVGTAARKETAKSD